MNDCAICLNELLDNTCITGCNHRFCKECLDKWFDSKKSTCPLCRENIKYFDHKGEMNRIVRIVQKEPSAPPRRDVINSLIVLKKKHLYYLVGGLTFTSVSLTLTTYLAVLCGNKF